MNKTVVLSTVRLNAQKVKNMLFKEFMESISEGLEKYKQENLKKLNLGNLFEALEDNRKKIEALKEKTKKLEDENKSILDDGISRIKEQLPEFRYFGYSGNGLEATVNKYLTDLYLNDHVSDKYSSRIEAIDRFTSGMYVRTSLIRRVAELDKFVDEALNVLGITKEQFLDPQWGVEKDNN